MLVTNSLGATAGTSEILAANAGGSFTNTGTVAANKIAGVGGFITINAADGGISSGIVGDTDQLVGLFADSGIVLNSRGPTLLANVVSGYLAGITLPSLDINQNTGYGGDVHIEALTTGSQPSSVTTTGPVNISGANIVINSTINYPERHQRRRPQHLVVEVVDDGCGWRSGCRPQRQHHQYRRGRHRPGG